MRSYKLTIGSRAAKEFSALPALFNGSTQRFSDSPATRAHTARRSSKADFNFGAFESATTASYSIDDDEAVIDVIGVPHRSKAYR